jgi:hypothetical protein
MGRGVQAVLAETGTGRREVAVEIECIDGDLKGTSITAHLMFGDEIVDEERQKSMTDKVFDQLEAMGWEGDLTDLSSIAKNVIRFGVKHEDYQGQTRAKVSWIGRAGGMAVKNRLTSEQAAAFAAQMKGKILARKRNGGSPAQQPKDTVIRDKNGKELF